MRRGFWELTYSANQEARASGARSGGGVVKQPEPAAAELGKACEVWVPTRPRSWARVQGLARNRTSNLARTPSRSRSHEVPASFPCGSWARDAGRRLLTQCCD